MLNVSALLLDEASKNATPPTNSAINQTLRQFAPLSDNRLLQLDDCCESLTLIGHPPYLTNLLQYHKSSVSTRSSTSQLLAIPWHNLSFGSRSVRVSAPKIWNSSTPQIRQCQTLATFRRHLKTHYFESAFSAT